MPFQFFQQHGCHKSRLSGSLNGQRWRFLRSGLDDFREGFLPSLEGIITQPARGPSPPLLSGKPKNLVRASQGSRKMLTEPQSYTSKLSLVSRTRRDHIAQAEYCLSQHPLALYPHLQESIPAELFKEVMSVLDPDVLPASQEPDANLEREPRPPSTIPPLLEDKRNRQARAKRVSCKGPKNKAPYTWFSPIEVAARELEARLNYVPPLDENIKQVTKDLCDGFDSLGGEKYNIDEDAVLSMFDEGYKTMLPIFLPIHVEELHDLPMDLRKHVGMPPSQAMRKNPDQDVQSSKDPCQPRWEKIRYGAWYLDPKTWKKQKANEPLENPKAKESNIKNSRKIISEESAKFIQLHGTHAFREFLERKGYRIPEFLQQMLEEQNGVGPKVGALKNTKNEFQRCKELKEDYSSVMGN
ncbi:protein FAM47E-like [Python bivittatus]|uniref:Protein FAM47E-like n=1 Tax=Python bivittatus TaxID=176946 RepID=A0A9F5N487_PYTBI|nr:protein FAM47E-like [Python bivittatus]